MKIEKHLRGLSDRLNAVSGSSNDNNEITRDDDYYLAIGSEPPGFAYYRSVRAQEWQALGHRPRDHVYDQRITQDELDFMLKKKLRVPPEQRYQHEKQNWFFHKLSYLHQTVDENGKAVDIIKESGCGHRSNKFLLPIMLAGFFTPSCQCLSAFNLTPFYRYILILLHLLIAHKHVLDGYLFHRSLANRGDLTYHHKNWRRNELLHDIFLALYI